MNIVDVFDPKTEWNETNGSGNWNRDARRTVLGVAMHKTGFVKDTVTGVINHFHNRGTCVSSTYVVDYDGTVYRVVPEEFVSYATGGSPSCLAKWEPVGGHVLYIGYGVNLHTISIEVMGATGVAYTDAQLRAVKELVVGICKRYGIVSGNVFGHKEVQADKRDGCEAIDEIRKAVDGTVSMDPNDFENLFFRWWISGGVAGNKQTSIYQTIKDRVRNLEFLSPPVTDETEDPMDADKVQQFGVNWVAIYSKGKQITEVKKI